MFPFHFPLPCVGEVSSRNGVYEWHSTASDAVDLLTESLAVRTTSSVPSDPRLEITRRHLARAAHR